MTALKLKVADFPAPAPFGAAVAADFAAVAVAAVSGEAVAVAEAGFDSSRQQLRCE